MEARCTSGNRELILRVLQDATGEQPIYQGLPAFSYSVGGYTLRRDGWIEADAPEPAAFPLLAALGLCEWPCAPTGALDPRDIVYPAAGHTGATLVNLIGMLSARQRLLNRALDARGAFFVAPKLMASLRTHPPATVAEFLQALYGRNDEYRGIAFSLERIVFTGFRKARVDEAHIHRQLADLIVRAALSQQWAKSFTPRVRNQKFALRTWLNAIGMIGPDYEEARLVLLSRLPGRSDRRSLTAGKAATAASKGGDAS